MIRFSQDPRLLPDLEDLFQQMKQAGFDFSIDTTLSVEDVKNGHHNIPLIYMPSGMESALVAQGFTELQIIEFEGAIEGGLAKAMDRIVAENPSISQDITLPLIIVFDTENDLSKIRIYEDGYFPSEPIGVMKQGPFTLEMVEALFELWYRMRIHGLPSDLPDEADLED